MDFTGLSTRCSFDSSYKYIKAHIYSSVVPYILEDDFIGAIGNSKFFITIRDDDWYIMRGGSDPEFARAYIKKMPKTNMEGFCLGPDGYIWVREYTSKSPDSVKKEEYKNEAISNMQDASEFWKVYADQVSNFYNPEFLTRMAKFIDLKVIQAEVDNDIVLVGKRDQ